MFRVASVLAVAAVVAAAALAEEAPPSEKAKPAASAGEDAIAAAARDFQKLKAERGTTAEPERLSIPGLTAPALQVGEGGSASASVLPAKRDPKQSPNWLVDGVMKKSGQGLQEKSLPGREHLLDAETRAGEPAADATRGRGEKTDEVARDKPAGPEVNPLTRYMAGWMTPSDYTLLRPGLSGDLAADGASRGDPSLTALATGPEAGGLNGSLLSLSAPGGAPAIAAAAPRDNPFLQAFVPSSQPMAVFTPPPAIAEPAVPSPNRFTPPPEPPPERPKVPELAKPADDTKYFKQLKRF